MKTVSRFAGLLCCFFLMPVLGCTPSGLTKEKAQVPKVYTIEINKFTFHPLSLTVKHGDTIRWINKDIVPHHIADSKRTQWESEDLITGDDFILNISASTTYICTLHPTMKASIHVK